MLIAPGCARGFGLGILVGAALVLPARGTLAQTPQPAVNTCLSCHVTQQDPRLAAPARLYSESDVHRESRFACIDCHGGDASATDKRAAHAPARQFKGKPAAQAQIETCARCHSDAELMRGFAPRQRVDQAAEYATSVHGRRLAGGDTTVATCASCHGAHGIRRVSDAKSPVFPTNVAATCASCHASPEHMAGHKLASGAPLPTNQLADYEKSVHYAALTKTNDLSAPTCNDCHGNHGAAPPGVGTVANVCGTCHTVFAQKFATSVHRDIFDKGCAECHGNHAVLRPSDQMLGTGAGAVCGGCHSGADDKGAATAEKMRISLGRLQTELAASDALLRRVKNAGIDVGSAELALADARSHLLLARTELHSSNAEAVDNVVGEGLGILADVDKTGQNGLAELRYRRRGLAVSLGAILFVVVTLGLKVRQIDRRHASQQVRGDDQHV